MERNTSLDLLRILAICAVMLIHCLSGYVQDGDENLRILSHLCRWCVPVFVMLSGAFLLDKDCSISAVWKFRLPRMCFLLVFSVVFYNLVEHRSTFSIEGKYHLWFMYMLIALYIVIPFLKAIVNSGYGWYYIAVWICFQILPYTFNVEKYYGIDLFVRNRINLILGYTGYFVLGNLMLKEKFTHKHRFVFYLIAILSILFIIFVFPRINIFSDSYLSLPIWGISSGIFLLFKTIPIKQSTIISFFSGCTLVVYLIHPFILERIERMLTIHSPLLLYFLVQILSFSFACIVKKIPLLKKLF